MTIGKELTPKLQKLVLRLEDDLRARLEEDQELKVRWQSEHADALHAERTSSAWVSWRDDRMTQAAVGWVLTTVFLRFCEDNALLSKVWISGPGARRQEAFDAENAYFRAHPENTWREWILEGITHLRSFPATAGLVDEHAALWQVSPSGAMAKEILDFWRATDEAGVPLYDFGDKELSTRFLGDLYQDLSEYAKKTFALLQTPVFVEEFILDQTLTPALAERPLEGFQLIDPTCGSGHFLLGGFQRLLDEWSIKSPDMETRERVQKALDAVHGVDLNPFAVAIARFRLTVAALKATGEPNLERAPAFDFHLASGDSLLHGRTQRELDLGDFGILDTDTTVGGFAYATEDLEHLNKLLSPGQYDVVVGNPPYIQVKDKALNQHYRKLYEQTATGKYALSAPFMERFFQLAKFGTPVQPAGWTGQITANSFMKRDFGVRLIEDFLPRQDLTAVIDSEGAWIPGHNSDGTPTAILIGRHQPPARHHVRAVLSKGLRESRESSANGTGPYWRTIVDHIGGPDIDNEWVTIMDMPRQRLARHPWSLSGGGANDLVVLLERAAVRKLGDQAASIGIVSFTLEDDVFLASEAAQRIRKVPSEYLRHMILGNGLRNYEFTPAAVAIFPYGRDFTPLDVTRESFGEIYRAMWPYRTNLSNNAMFGRKTKVEAGLQWTEYGRLTASKLATPLSITFAFVATHNHFVLDRGGKIFNRSAPVIKLPEGASEDEHVALLGILNSSTACFWLKQKSQPKGGASDLFWSRTYEFTATTLEEFPLPAALPLDRGRQLDALAQSLNDTAPSQILIKELPTAQAMEQAQLKDHTLRRQMVAIQEELDWEIYRLYGLVDDDLTYKNSDLPDVELGQRAFEIAIARKTEMSYEEKQWFAKHGSTSAPEIPSAWPEDYRNLVRRRVDSFETNPHIRLLEKPEYKRRWEKDPWSKRQELALRGWLLDRMEDPSFWFDAQDRPVARSVAQLADVVSRNAELVSVLSLWDKAVDVDVTKALTKLLTDEAVPYLSAQRLKDSGLRKHEAWDETWELQRREDNGLAVGKAAVPPKYSATDFRSPPGSKGDPWWQARGKLDVPMERFILYPDAGRSTDPTLLLGWAGWDHVQQFLVLAAIMDERVNEGADDSELVPLVAGMAEVLPWVKQWHADLDPAFGMSMSDFCSAQLEERMTQLNVSTTDLKTWRPAATTRGRRAIKENA